MKSKTKFQTLPFIILCGWCLLPLFACLRELYTGATVTSEFLLDASRMSIYQDVFMCMGLFTLLPLLFYLAKKSSDIFFSFNKVKSYFKNNAWILFYILLLLWITFSALHSPSLIDAFAGARYRNMGLFTYIVFGCIMICPLLLKSEQKQLFLMYLFLAVADLVAVVMLIQEKNLPLFNNAFGMLRSSVFVHFNHLGYYLNLASICASGLLIFEHKKSRCLQTFTFLSLLLLFYTLLINNTMGGILSCLITSVILLWFYYLRNRHLDLPQFIPIIAIVILVALSYTGCFASSSGENMSDNFMGLYTDANKLIENENVDSIGTLRFSLWKYYGKMIPEHPIFGLGPDQEPVGYETYVISDRPANEYLYHAVFHGIPALIFYLGFLISLAVYGFKHIKELSPSAMIAAGCVITYCISAFFGNAIYYTACYLFLFLGFLLPRNNQID